MLAKIRDICHGCDTLQLIQNKKLWLCADCVFKKNHNGKSKDQVYSERQSQRTKEKIKGMSTGIQKRQGGKEKEWGDFKVGCIKQISNKRAVIENDLRLVYKKIDSEREHMCEGCGSYNKPLSHSHLLSRYFRPDLITEALNIRLHCFGDYNSCHEKWERGSPVDLIEMLDFKENLTYIKEVDFEAYSKIIANFEFNGIKIENLD